MVIVLYIVALILFTCTENIQLLLKKQEIQFNFNPDPRFSDLLHNDLAYLNDITYLLQKIGHFAFFFFLAVLVYWGFKKWFYVVVISATSALFTEIAQLFFSRSGRLLDVSYDLAGVLLFVLLYQGSRYAERCYRRVLAISGEEGTSRG